MKKTDIIKLRLKGVPTDEIKQLMELETMAEDSEDIQEQEQTNDQTEDQTNDQTEETPEETPEMTEMKKQLEDMTAQLKENEEKLKAAQKANINKDISGQTDQKSDQDILDDLVRAFM